MLKVKGLRYVGFSIWHKPLKWLVTLSPARANFGVEVLES